MPLKIHLPYFRIISINIELYGPMMDGKLKIGKASQAESFLILYTRE